jgi:RNA polymerase sigma-70 factor (ECF subfamily)
MADAKQQPAQVPDASIENEESAADAVSRLFRESHRMLVRYLTVRLRSEQEAKEVAQEAYLRLLQTQRPESADIFRAYLFKTAANLAIDRLRHRRVRRRVEQDEATAVPRAARGALEDPAKLLIARELAEQLTLFLTELPPKCQEVFSLHRLEGLSQQAVAARLGFSDRMVRRYITYTMVYCRLRLDGSTIDEARERVVL